MTSDKTKILFLCVGNSCRSQMAEAWANILRGDEICAYSAGVEPSSVNPYAVKAMAEAGIDISKHHAKHPDELKEIDFDFVVTLCDKAKEGCPIYSGKMKIIHKSFEDPTIVTGNEEQIMLAFRKVRDEIKQFVQQLDVKSP